MIYFDNAATTVQKSDAVIRAVTQAMTGIGNSGRGAYETALSASRLIYQTRLLVAQAFGVPGPERVIFTSGATQALNTAIFGVLRPGDHAIASDLDHNSVLRPLYHLQKQGVIDLDFLPADQTGRIRKADLAAALRPNTRLVCLCHGSNLTGNVTDPAPYAELAHNNGALFLLDASQTAGLLPISMEDMGLDLLCFSGHKALMGPQGIGCLCLSRRAEVSPLLYGGTGVQTELPDQPPEYPTRLEAGTLNGPGIAGLHAALEELSRVGMQTVFDHESRLAGQFVRLASQIPGLRLYGDFDGLRTGTVSLNVRDYPSSEVADELAVTDNIAVRAGAHCVPRLHRALGTHAQGAVRFSFGWYNTMEEVETALAALRRIASC